MTKVRRKGSDEFDYSIMSGSRGEPGIARQQRCVKGFCQSNIGCVIGGHIVAEFPDSGQKQIMRVTDQRKVGEVFYGLKTPGDQGRGVYNDHLPSLSALTALAGGTLVFTGVRWVRRLRSSARVGRSAIRWTS